MRYQIRHGLVGQKPYFIKYHHYLPNKPAGDSVIVLVCGGGHLMKVWEKTPDGRKGWASLLAEKGREVITVEWACNSPDVYKCSTKELCRLTQKENMDLIKQVIEKEVLRDRKVILLGWSMGGPQIFKLACDIIPQRVAAILGYGATGPLNCFTPSPEHTQKPIDFNKPFKISPEAVSRMSDSPLFPKKHLKKYVREYLVPFSPLMKAIQSKRLAVRKYWNLLTIKNPKKIPPVFLVNGERDRGYQPSREKVLTSWLKKYQKDVSVKHMKDFPHLGMLCRNNEKVVDIYLVWLRLRGL
ncbi:MAG: alpha/beta hydrolase [Patescibacteria group bacterium]